MAKPDTTLIPRWGRFAAIFLAVALTAFALDRYISGLEGHKFLVRFIAPAFADEQPSLKSLPTIPYSAVLTVERRVSKEGMISVGGNFYSVPDTTRRRTLEVQHHTEELRIFEDGQLIARHPVLEGKARRRVDPAHRKAPPKRPASPPSSQGLRRPLDFYDAVGRRLAAAGAQS